MQFQVPTYLAGDKKWHIRREVPTITRSSSLNFHVRTTIRNLDWNSNSIQGIEGRKIPP